MWAFLSCCPAGAADVPPFTPGSLDTNFIPAPIFNRWGVNRLALQPDGKILVGGYLHKGIARLNLNGSLDAGFQAEANDVVHAVLLQPDGRILIGGKFTQVNGQARNRIARLDANGTPDTTWNPGTGVGGLYPLGVRAIALQNDKIIIGGGFPDYNQTPREGLARLNADGSLDLSFATGLSNALVSAIAVQPDGKVIIGGGFQIIPGAGRHRIARLNPDGSFDSSFVAPVGTNDVSSILLQSDGRILVGYSMQWRGDSHPKIARLHTDGSVDTSFNPGLGADRSILTMALESDGKILVGGEFKVFSGLPRSGITRLYPDGTIDAGFYPGAGVGAFESINSIALQPDRNIIISGGFDQFDGTPISNVARLHGGDLPPAAPVIINSLAGQTVTEGQGASFLVNYVSATPVLIQWRFNGTNLIGETNAILSLLNIQLSQVGEYSAMVSNASGSASTAPATLQLRARATLRGGLDATFDPGQGPNGRVKDIAVQNDGKVLIAGEFTTVNEIARSQIARLNADGSLDTTFDPGSGATGPLNTSGSVSAIHLQGDGRILVSGDFRFFNGIARSGFARLEANGRLDETFNPTNIFGPILALQADGKILIYGGQGVVRLHPDGTSDPCFEVRLEIRAYGDSTLPRATLILQQPDGKLMMIGSFAYVNGVPRNGLARLHLDGSVDLSFDAHRPGYGGVRCAALQPDGKLLLGSSGITSLTTNLIRLNQDGSRDSSFNPGAGVTGRDEYPYLAPSVFAMAVEPSGKIIVGGQFLSVQGVPRLNLARLHGEGRLDASFDTGSGIDGSFPYTYPSVEALSLTDEGKLLIGGNFRLVNGVARNFIARIHGGESAGPPSINIHPENQIAVAGQNVAFSVFASSEPLPGYQWLLNNVPLLGANQATLSLPAVTTNQSGRIQAVVSNSFGMVTSRVAILTVEAADIPVIVTQPQSQAVSQGENVVFSVVATSRTALLYQWQRNGSDIPGATGPRLLVYDVEAARAGNYQVIVRNAFGSVASGIASLSLNAGAPVAPGTIDRSYAPDATPDGPVFAAGVQPDGSAVIGGGFYSVEGSPLFVTRFLADGAWDRRFQPFQEACCRTLFSHRIQDVEAQPDGGLLIAGTVVFSRVPASPGNYFHRLTPEGCLDTRFQTGRWEGAGAGVALAVQSDGKILVAGTFTSLNGLPRTNLARLNRDGRIDGPQIPLTVSGGEINAVAALTGGKILIAGNFNSVNGVARNKVALLNPDGSLEPRFDPGAGPDKIVKDLAIQSDGKILLVGEFTSVSGHAANRIARLSSDGRVDTNFKANLAISGVLSYGATQINSVGLDERGQILIAGNFSTANDLPRPGLLRLYGDAPRIGPPEILIPPASIAVAETTKVTLSAWVIGRQAVAYQWQRNGTNLPGFTNDVLFLENVQLHQSGDYRLMVTNPYGVVTSAVATVTISGGTRPSILAEPGDQTVIAGQNVVFSVSAHSYITPSYQWRFNGADIPEATGPSFNLNNVRSQAAGLYSVVISNPTGAVASRDAALAVTPAPTGVGSVDIDFYPGTGATLSSPFPQSGAVNLMQLQADGKIIIAGPFTHYDGVPRPGLARLHADGSLDRDFSHRFESGNPANPLRSIALQKDGKILLAGWFYRVNESVSQNIARLNVDGRLDASFKVAPGTDGALSAVAVQSDGKIIIGGRFFTYNDQGMRRSLARLFSDGSLDPGFVTAINANHNVIQVAVLPDDKIVVAREYIDFSNGLRQITRIERLHPDGALDTNFNAPLNLRDVTLRALVPLRDGRILLGGYPPDSALINGLLRLEANGTVDWKFKPQNRGWVNALAEQADGKILLARDVVNSPTPETRLARLDPSGNFDFVLPSASGPGPSVLVLVPDAQGRILIGGSFTNVDGFVRNGVARLHGFDQPVLKLATFAFDGRRFQVFVKTVERRRYVLEYKNSLSDPNWQPGPVVEGDGTVKPLSDSAAAGAQRFYRVRTE